MKVLSLQIPEDLYDWLKTNADKHYMTISAYSRMLLLQKKENTDGDNL